jgi:transposase-like protein
MDSYETARLAAKDAESAIVARICEDFNLTPVLARAHYQQMARYFEPSRVGCRFLVMKDGDMPKTYDPEFKARAVRLVRDHLADYGSVTAASFAVGAQLGVSRETLRRWVAQAEVDDGARPGLTTAEADELRRLRAENKRLREANEILKAASIFFAGELDSRNR